MVVVATAATVYACPRPGLHGQAAEPSADGDYGRRADLPLPHTLPLLDYERKLYRFLFTRGYKELGWSRDKGVRDTGPYLALDNYGPHPAVRIYYSPGVMSWLAGGRTTDIPDGAMIIKEMFEPPAARLTELLLVPKYAKDPARYEAEVDRKLTSWTVMVRDKAGSDDGWFWAGPSAPTDKCGHPKPDLERAIEEALDKFDAPFNYPASGVGLSVCMRCHASAAEMMTFASLRNIEGYPEAPLRYRVDNSWRVPAKAPAECATEASQHLRPPAPKLLRLQPPVNPAFLAAFAGIEAPKPGEVKAFPGQWLDHAVMPAGGPGKAGGPGQYVTSDNCMACHGGLGGAPYGLVMFVPTGPKAGDGYSVAEYGEWRWSPMGLAGRDPIFHSQLESELALLVHDADNGTIPKEDLRETQQALINTCLSCHGAMGQRQLSIDAEAKRPLPNGELPDPDFNPEYYYLEPPLEASTKRPPHEEYWRYGALAREGISCAVCHHIAEAPAAEVAASGLSSLAYFLMHNTTGRYARGPADELYGPFDDVKPKPMENALGVIPTANPFIQDSRMCGTCHTINLPNVDKAKGKETILDRAETNPAFLKFEHSIEQATFLEWQNSAFVGPDGQSCQDCHMPETAVVDGATHDLNTQIASIEDSTYPEVDNGLPNDDVLIRTRDDYRRHELVGLNVLLLEMFDQFDDVLGVAKTDYMTGAKTGQAFAVQNMNRQARDTTVGLSVRAKAKSSTRLEAVVEVKNKVGHRFPSGVGFRRAFIELLVTDKRGTVVWGSGRTDQLGMIVGADGKRLPSEFHEGGAYQPHYGSEGHRVVNAQDQVQIYEELIRNAAGQFTTSFVHRDKTVKDNRLLPRGWRASSYFASKDSSDESAKVIEAFMEATDPEGVEGDPDYQDAGPEFAGRDEVTYVIDLPRGVRAAGLTVRATMYFQSVTPAWMKQRFETAPNGPATQRLFYMLSRLQLKDSPMAGWKLPVGSAAVTVGGVRPR